MSRKKRRAPAEPSGQPQPIKPSQRAPETPADRAALDARCRRFGIATSDAARALMRHPEASHPLGMCLMRLCDTGDEVARRWAAFMAWDAAERTYLMRKIGKARTPKAAAMAMVPDQGETGADAPPADLRSEVEKLDAATNGWMRWQGFLGRLPAAAQRALHDARRHDGPAIWAERQPTAAGSAAAEALALLADAASGMLPQRKHNP